MSVLVLNTGSSSVKFELFEGEEGSLISTVSGLVEGIGEPQGHVSTSGGVDEPRVFDDHEGALEGVIGHLEGHLDGLVAVGHRVVHGGEHFTAPTVLDDIAVEAIRSLSPLAPLHNPPALEGIRAARALRPDLPHVAVFDTAFHASLAPEAYRYAVPGSWYEDHGVRRYGFHGTSHHYVALQAATTLGRPLSELAMITLHLGNGASACAMDGGRSVDTSMGLSPLEGLVMGTRSGDLDPAVVFHMLRAGWAADEVERTLNRESGLKGLTGDNDMRRVHRAADAGDPAAQLALAVTARRLRKYVGGYLAELGGLDALVFTAGIGEHSPSLRAAVVEPLGHLGLRLDGSANERADAGGGPVRISPAGADPAVLVVATDEERMIAAETLRAIGV